MTKKRHSDIVERCKLLAKSGGRVELPDDLPEDGMGRLLVDITQREGFGTAPSIAADGQDEVEPMDAA